MFLRADSGGKVIRLKHWNKIKPWVFVLVQIGTIRSRNTKTRKNLEERAANWEQAERFDRIQLCFPLLYVSLGWVIHSVFCSSFRNTDNMFWFMDSFFAYFNYLLINLSALVAADTHTMLQDARKHQRIIIISFPKKSWVKGRTACSLSCPLLSFSLCSSSTETSEKEKDKCALPPSLRVCVCVCVTCPDSFWVALISFSRPNSLQMQTDLSFCQISFIMTELVSAALPALSSARRLLLLW